jgi:hypothetical protein
LTKCLAFVLTDRLKIVLCGGALIRGHEIGHELMA